MPHILDKFSSAFRQYGLTPPDQLIADGRIHRFKSGPEQRENGYYRLTILPAHKGGEIGFGLIGCWKRGIQEKWSSHQRGEIGEVDRAAIKLARAEQKKVETQEAAAAIQRVKEIWAKSGPVTSDHPYLLAKGIKPLGIRQHKDALVVPVFRDGGMVSLQFIAPDGTKRFLRGGSVEGGYASVGAKGADKGRIAIAEGYATGVSLHLAIGWPTVVAFNAGNLGAVAKAIRAKYPEAEIVIAADNDRFTVVRGKPVNVGIEAAKKAAAAINAGVSWANFPADDEEKPTDFNDYATRYGLEKTAQAFHAREPEPPRDAPIAEEQPPIESGSPDFRDEPPPYVTEPHDYPPEEGRHVTRLGGFGVTHSSADWKSRLIPGKEVAEGHPFPFDGKSKTNAYLFLKHHERFAGLLCYNEFTDSVMLSRRPPWDEGDSDPAPGGSATTISSCSLPIWSIATSRSRRKPPPTPRCGWPRRMRSTRRESTSRGWSGTGSPGWTPGSPTTWVPTSSRRNTWPWSGRNG